MRIFGFFWGVGGVIALLAFAMYRLSPYALELGTVVLTPLHWLALVANLLFMAYSEGYKGFYRQFSPRVVRRASYLGPQSRAHELLLAPLFCMGFFHATRARMIASYGLTFMIIGFVLAVRFLPQPWRGIVDAGVLLGLAMGIASLLYFLARELRGGGDNEVSPGFPDNSYLLNP